MTASEFIRKKMLLLNVEEYIELGNNFNKADNEMAEGMNITMDIIYTVPAAIDFFIKKYKRCTLPV